MQPKILISKQTNTFKFNINVLDFEKVIKILSDFSFQKCQKKEKQILEIEVHYFNIKSNNIEQFDGLFQ